MTTYAKNKVIIQSHDDKTTQVLSGLDFSTFQLTITKNEAYQLDFTANDDGSVGFNLLTVENIVIYDGQKYVIKQVTDDNTDGKHTITVTAMHIFYQLNNIFQFNVKTGDNSFTLTQALKFLFNGVSGGYSYRINGTFNSSKTLTDFGNTSVVEGLSTLKDAFNVYAIVPDNMTINLYDEKSYVKKTYKAFRYRHDTSSMQLQYDSSTMVNRVQAVSTAETPAFKPFIVQDNDSINKWGVHDGARVESDSINDTNAMKTLASQSFILEPTISITVVSTENDGVAIGEQWHVLLPDSALSTAVEVVSVVTMPLATTAVQVTLNNNRSNFLDAQRVKSEDLKQASGKSSMPMWVIGEV